MSKAPHLWGETSLGTSDVPFGDSLVFETEDTRGAEFVAQVESVAFAADGTTTHKDQVLHIGVNKDHVDSADRAGFLLVLEYEPTDHGTNRTVAGATNATPIRVTMNESTATLTADDAVFIEGVLGNTAANGYFKAKNKQSLRGTSDASAAGLYGGGGTLNGLTLILNVNGAGATTLNLNGATNAASKAALLAAIAVQWAAITATDAADSVGHNLLLTNSSGTGSIVVGAGTANTALGLTAGTYSSKCFEAWHRVVGGADVPVAGNGAYTTGGEVVDRMALEAYWACQAPGTSTQNRPISMLFNGDGDFKSQVGVGGALTVYDTTGTVVHLSIPDGSGALTATLGATGTSISLSSVEKIDITAGAASTWKTSAGALTIDSGSPGGILFKRGGNAYGDIGATDSTWTLAADISLAGAAGAGALSLGSMTGATAMPTGNFVWTGASTKVATITANGSGGDITLTSNGGGVSATCGAALLLSAGTTTSLQSSGNMSIATAANVRTIAIGNGNAVQTLNLCNHATPVNVIGIGGAASTIGLYGVTPAAQGAVGATLTNSVTSGGSANVINNITAASVDTSAAKLTDTRDAIYQLALKLATLEAELKLLGAVKT